MNILKLIPIMKKYERCPDCENQYIGNGEGGIIIEDETYTRFCKCGFKITVDEDDLVVIGNIYENPELLEVK